MEEYKSERYCSYLELLKHISEIASGTDTIEDFLSKAVTLITSTMSAERCSIMLRENNKLVLKASSSIPKEEWNSIILNIGEGISGKVASDNKPFLVSNIENSDLQSSKYKEDAGKYTTNSFISAPLSFKDRNLGVINVTNPVGRGEFAADDLAFLLSISNYITMLLENSRLLASNIQMKDYLYNILNSLPVGVISVCDHLNIIQFNSVIEKLTGIQLKKFHINKPLKQALPTELADIIITSIQKYVNNKKLNQREILLKNYLKGTTTPVNMIISPMQCPGDQDAAHFVIFLEDLSLIKEVNELHRLNEMKNNFISMVSHELRTPLTSIKGATHILSSSVIQGLPDSTKELIRIIGTNTDRLIKLVRDLLDVSHIENQTFSLMKRSGDLKKIILESIEQMQEKFDRKKLNVGFEYKSPLREVAMDADRIKTVILDLLDNAWKFTSEGDSIFITVFDMLGNIEISIKDTGPGIDDKYADKIFDKFFQIQDTMTRSAGGTGLGLYLARMLTQLHGGKIHLNTEYKAGAEFIVTLPLIAEEELAVKVNIPDKKENRLEENGQ